MEAWSDRGETIWKHGVIEERLDDISFTAKDRVVIPIVEIWYTYKKAQLLNGQCQFSRSKWCT